MGQNNKPAVIFLPGIIQPSAIQYEPLGKVLDVDIKPLYKDLEVYARNNPSPGYTLTAEIEGLRYASERAGMETFNLVGYSGGGAVALAFIAAYPDKVDSLALCEPAVIPSQAWFEQESVNVQERSRVMDLPEGPRMREFKRIQLRDGVPIPPEPIGDPPPWMANRPAGIKTFNSALEKYDLPYRSLQTFTKPVYLAIGGLSNPIWIRMGEILRGLFPNIQIEVYANRHHFDPPQRAEPERFAQALRNLWGMAKIL